MDQEYAAFKEAFVQSLTPDDLAALTPEERLAGLSPEEIRRVAPVEELLGTLTPEERRRLFERLSADGFSPPGEQPAD